MKCNHCTSPVSDAEWQKILSDLTPHERSFLEGKPLSEAYKAGFAAAKRGRVAALSENAKLYPEGRTFYYEGDLPTECVDVLVGMYGLEPHISFHCPADMLDEIEDFFSDYPHALGT
jgi:hypothetical protein